MSRVRTGEIRALSGLRIVAALWVVLFHFRPLLAEAAPGFNSALAPILNAGAQGVDLFFILSGFVLTWNYLDRMGESWSTRSTLRFLWLRLARVWPVYLVTMHLAAAFAIFTLYVGGHPLPPPVIESLNAMSWLKQVLLTQLWFQPYFDGSSWNGPAWSISAEWLAYLLFGGLVLIIFRIASATRARGLIWLAIAAALAPTLLLLAHGVFYTPWSWLPRIVMQFTAGALACAAVRKLVLTDRTQKAAGVASLLMGAAIVGGLYLLDANRPGDMLDAGGLVDVLFVPLVITLAIGAGTLPALLSTPVMVYLGHISFGLYMVHEIVHTAWNWAVLQFGIQLAPSWWAKFVVLGLILFAGVAAALLYHVVEEPARRWMRRMVEPNRARPAQPTETAAGRLKPVAARAG
ncbi:MULTISPECIES: acyltransferase family protein [Mycolicibacterium]|uniref:Acyltransferase 3 n=4 Tax=Mycolicibacterium TaxID=1866885 RepID=A1T9E1_MYCVP|nr:MULTISPECIES: acyltransferase [Mycolicibacterium]ABM13791.1 acyltransferase 3 [Mycolicibacterium vanbaalenii PYR-1]MCV7128781.1 acyltransferase [Mycolicibacterium vanbaalenii PYR-1]MDN4518870.1 acyltransferase [Mycolicibacterium austroafricanum]MDW5609816.1 acyltransferase [Mycolicibacterium sp. D5.8-2]QRZ09541.1 acyltransferase [Mycolicibacterium austroafricanum]